MIRFYAQLYNASESEIIDSTQKVYTIGEYLGYRDPDSEVGADIMFGKEGQVINDLIPLTRVQYDITTNIGEVINDTAHRLQQTLGYYPVLRFLKTSEVDDNYLEWDPGQPRGFTIKVDGFSSRLENVFLWEESSVLPRVTFIKASNTADLLKVEIHYAGCIGIHGNFPCLVGTATGLFECDLPQLTTEKTFFNQDFRGNYTPSYTPYIAKTVIPDGTFNHYYGVVVVSRRNATTLWQVAGYVFSPINPGSALKWQFQGGSSAPSVKNIARVNTKYNYYYEYMRCSAGSSDYIDEAVTPFLGSEVTVLYTDQKIKSVDDAITLISSTYSFRTSLSTDDLYEYLMKSGGVVPEEPDSDVDPEDIPPEDEPPTPTPPDDQDPYYDPTSDPDNPEYDPTKDPDNPQYDPTEPHTPFRPPSGPSDPPVHEEQPPVDPIPTPETPPSYVTTNAMFTLYNPSGGDLTNLANFLWSPTWSIDTFKKIFANPLDCILGLMVMPHLNASVGTKVMNVGNISTGVTMHYFTSQFYDFDCGTFELMEYYNSYLDYAPYTKVDIFLPYIGDKQLSTDEVMNKTLGVKYRFDLATGDCVAFITVDGTVLYQFSGNCAARLPLAGNNWNGIIPAITGVAISAGSMAAGLPALGAASAAAVSTMKETISHTGGLSGSAGLMGVQTPYLIVTRPRQALPLSQNSFTGYPSFITESLGSLTGYTEVEQCHLEHVPATGAELEEIERLLKEGVLF